MPLLWVGSVASLHSPALYANGSIVFQHFRAVARFIKRGDHGRVRNFLPGTCTIGFRCGGGPPYRYCPGRGLDPGDVLSRLAALPAPGRPAAAGPTGLARPYRAEPGD